MYTLTGKIISGQRLASRDFLADPMYAKALGDASWHRGTINVLVADATGQHGIMRNIGWDPGTVRRQGYLPHCPCEIEGRRGYILGTWHPGAEYWPGNGRVDHHGHTNIEVVAPFIEGLGYGSTATLSYDPSKLTRSTV